MKEIIIQIITAVICIIALIIIASIRYYSVEQIQKDIINESLIELRENKNDGK